MATLDETINSLADDVRASKQTFEDSLFALQRWVEQNAGLMTEQDRQRFSETLQAARDPQTREGRPYGDDHSLVLSVLRLHAMRLLYRFDERKQGRPVSADDSAYGQARLRLQIALREAELAINEARIDTAIANAHNILGDRGANRRWLQDAMTRLQTIARKDLVKLVDALPAPELPPLSLWQRISFRLLGIRQEEAARRSMQSLRQIAQLQNRQLIEMARLLADSFQAIGDPLGGRQAINLLSELHDDE